MGISQQQVRVAVLELQLNTAGSLRVLALGAHADDIEIGAGGTLLRLAAEVPDLEIHFAVLSANPLRRVEALNSAAAFSKPHTPTIDTFDLPDGRFPEHWGRVKDTVESLARSTRPDVVISPSVNDAHQDHRTLAQIVSTSFRDHLHLQYEIPKWDGDLGQPNTYMPLTDELMAAKSRLLHEVYPSQQHHDWFRDDTFSGLARLRGMECRADYAEAFTITKIRLTTLQTMDGVQ
jgi:LmbE family N-acetylglucosaminyl deacetylase